MAKYRIILVGFILALGYDLPLSYASAPLSQVVAKRLAQRLLDHGILQQQSSKILYNFSQSSYPIAASTSALYPSFSINKTPAKQATKLWSQNAADLGKSNYYPKRNFSASALQGAMDQLAKGLTDDEFRRHYGDIFWDSYLQVTSTRLGGQVYFRSLKFTDSDGFDATVKLTFHIHPDSGKLTVTIQKIYTHPYLRNGDVAARVLAAAVAHAQSLSQHPDTTVFLHAETCDFIDWDASPPELQEFYGAYIWTKYGFEFQSDGVPDQLKKLRLSFKAWLKDRYQNTLSDAELAMIVAASDQWVYPWDIGSFDVTAMLQKTVGPEKGRLGKEFLSNNHDGRQIAWTGVLYVNRPKSPGMRYFTKRFNKLVASGS